jgi:AcrR family transcriptional regulator
MSVERIVEAAIEIADESGLGSVSMAAVASRFGMTPMALYRYVTAKDDLVLLMQEYGIGAPPPIPDDVSWREGIQLWARANLECFLAHPWLLDVPVEGVPLTPNGLAWADAGVFALRDSGLHGGALLSALVAVNGEMRWIGELMRSRDGKPSVIDADNQSLFAQLITPDAYPWYHHAMFGDGPESDTFKFSMAMIIDGIAAAGRGEASTVEAPPAIPDDVRKDRKYREAQSRRRERERELQHAIREERQALREARRRADEG